MTVRTMGSVLAIGLALAVAAPASAQRPPVEHLRGTVTAVDGSALTLRKLDGGTATIALPQKLRVSGLAMSSLASVKKGTYLGTTAVPGPGGLLIAKELHLFPARMRGVGEGHRPWDLTPGSTMTNANVDLIVEQVKGRVLTLSYKGGMQKVLVPPDAPVVNIVKATRDELKSGAKVFVVARKGKDGALTAVRISIGKNGLMPPM
ncbi:MAG: hypothetical protein O7A03_02060 [Alphaproteobacteria bacterium]|nr:hypothetical protein [Alphaproteobacteria bacterium]